MSMADKLKSMFLNLDNKMALLAVASAAEEEEITHLAEAEDNFKVVVLALVVTPPQFLLVTLVGILTKTVFLKHSKVAERLLM